MSFDELFIQSLSPYYLLVTGTETTALSIDFGTLKNIEDIFDTYISQEKHRTKKQPNTFGMTVGKRITSMSIAEEYLTDYIYTEMAQLYDWLVQTPANANDLENRINTRPAHLEHNKPLIESGILVWGGPALAHHPGAGEDLPITGSIMCMRAASEEEVRERLRNDPYSKVGFWYPEQAVITPMRCVVRKPL